MAWMAGTQGFPRAFPGVPLQSRRSHIQASPVTAAQVQTSRTVSRTVQFAAHSQPVAATARSASNLKPPFPPRPPRSNVHQGYVQRWSASRDNVVLPAQLGLGDPNRQPFFLFSHADTTCPSYSYQSLESFDSTSTVTPPLTPWPHRSSNSSVANVASWPWPCRVLFLVVPRALSLVSGLSPAPSCWDGSTRSLCQNRRVAAGGM